MAMTLPIIVYGFGDLYFDYFNAIARCFGETSYQTLQHVTILMGGFTVLFSFVMKRDIMEIVRWLGLFYVVMYVLFTPKVTVEIIDTVNNRPYAVANVPLGLGILANVTTTISDGLTQLTEMNFSMPDDLRYHTSGMVFASQLVREAGQFEITDTRIDGNIQGFIQQCVFYDMLLGRYGMSDLFNAKDIWNFILSDPSPARGFIYTDKNNISEFTTCRDASQPLKEDMKEAVEQAENEYAPRVFSTIKDSATQKSQFLKYLPASYAYLTQLSLGVNDIMNQNLIGNALQRGILRMGATSDASAAMQSYAYVRAQDQKRLTNQTAGEMAAYWLPLIKDDLELITYGSFIFIMLLSLFPFGVMILKSYIYTLVWIELWPPLYAIVNLTVSAYGKSQSVAAIQTAGGITLKAMPGLLQINSDIAGLAGYLSMSVPAIAGGLLWGMHHAFSQVAQYANGVTQSIAGSAASEASTGNFSFGNTNFGNHNAFNRSAHHTDTSFRYAGNTISTQLSDGTQLSVMPDGSDVLNMSNTMSNIGANISFSKALHNSYSESADKATTSAQNSSAAYGYAETAGLRSMNELTKHLDKSASNGDVWTISSSSGVHKAFAEVHTVTEDLAKRFHISYGDAANLAASIYADGKVGVSGNIAAKAGWPGGEGISGGVEGSLSIGGGASRTSTHTNNTDRGSMYSDAKDFLSNTNYNDNVDVISRASRDNSLRVNSDEGNRLVDSMGSSFDRAESYRQETQNSLQQAESYRRLANRSEEDSARIEAIGSNEFVKWFADQPNREGNGKLGVSSLPDVMHDPALRDRYLNQFLDEYRPKMEANWSHDLASSGNAVEHHYQQMNSKIQGKAYIESVNQKNHADIERAGQARGLTPNHMIDQTVVKQYNDTMRDNTNKVQINKEAIQSKGNNVKQKFEHEKLRERHGGLAKDMIFDIDTKDHA